MKSPSDPCPICGYAPLERGGLGDPRGVDSSETECLRCLAQHALDDDGRIEFTFDLPGRPLPPEAWNR